MELVIIAAVSEDNVIGYKGGMPWGRIKEDLSHFRELTLNHPIIMGRKTFESIGRPLDKRVNIVLSNSQIEVPSIFNYNNLDEAIKYAGSLDKTAFIIGGETLYRQAIYHQDVIRLELTRIPGSYEGDTFFPVINENIWRVQKMSCGEACNFVTYTRR
jgi:dihydrofolate reductase